MVSTRNQTRHNQTNHRPAKEGSVMARKKDAAKKGNSETDDKITSANDPQLNNTVEDDESTAAVSETDGPTTCIHQQQTNQHNFEPVKESSGVKAYLKGFGKRVIICSILVMVFRSLWPRLQPIVWPEAAGKEGKLYVLTDRSFRGHVSRGDHFVMMYAPWCGHCQAMKPAWEKLAKSPGVSGVKISKLDCTANELTCKTHEVHGYPTLLYFRNGENIGKHDGDKSLEALKRFIKKMNKTLDKGSDKAKPKKKKEL